MYKHVTLEVTYLSLGKSGSFIRTKTKILPKHKIHRVENIEEGWGIKMYYNPYSMSFGDLKSETLKAVSPFVNYGLQEATFTSHHHALTEVAAIAYLLGKGFDPQTAYKTVESWEVNETF
jgi:hypothetical protein